MNDHQLKINWKNILIVGMAVLLLILLITNANRANEMEYLNNRINNLTSELNLVRNDIRSIYNNVDEQMKKQASLLTSVDYALGELDTKNQTIDVQIKVVPKNITPNMTLSVKLGDTVANFNQSGKEFTAVIPVDMFLDYDEHPMLYINSENGIQTEILEDVIVSNLSDRYLPKVYADIPADVSYSKGRIELDSHLHISTKPSMYGNDIYFVTYELVTELNGEEIERADLTDKVREGIYDERIRKSIPAKQGETVVIYLLAEDSLGYTHKTTVFSWYENQNGVQVEMETAPIISSELDKIIIYD